MTDQITGNDFFCNDLATYVAAIRDPHPSGVIAGRKVKKDNWVAEDGMTTEYQEQTVEFINGVVIRQTIEQEQPEADMEQLCPECWIRYDVVSQPEGVCVLPQQKNFVNNCQEVFWLKARRAHQLSA